jgi:hypothetical protein
MDRERAAWQQRVSRLEKLGEVPETAGPLNSFDWQAAQETSWWGKPLDPEKFWKGRVVWLDDSTVGAAARHGRAYPPMPYNDPTLSLHKTDVDIEEMSGGVEELRLIIHFTSKEGAFWDKFSKTHPKPPEDLEGEQSMMGLLFRYKQFDPLKSEVPGPLLTERMSHLEQLEKKGEQIQIGREVQLGYPPEAFAQNALFWEYVVAQRREYQKLVNVTHAANNVAVSNLLEQLSVDPKCVTDPLPGNAIQKANAWKIAYLQRLSREKVDQSYINAYLKEWNLKPGELFTNVATSPR